MVEGLEKSGEDWRVLLLPDHATPISIKTHSRDPVPFTITGTGIEPDGVESFDEDAAKRGRIRAGGGDEARGDDGGIMDKE